MRVPESNLVGERGRGYAQFLRILDEGRIAIAALATGLAQGCVDESVKYASEREAFGRPIGAHQAVSFMIADMEIRAYTSVWRGVTLRPGWPQANPSSAKLLSRNFTHPMPRWTIREPRRRCMVGTASPSNSPSAVSIETRKSWKSVKVLPRFSGC